MKNASTWYLLVLAVLNVLLAQGTSYAAMLWTSAYREVYGKYVQVAIGVGTQFSLRYYWWPYLFAGVAIILALISMRSRLASSVFYQIVIGLLIIEVFILFLAQITFVLPLISTQSQL